MRALLNEEGRITDKYRYSAYGELVERSGETENHFLYTGEYYDGVSDLYYLRARYMSPSTGTFISMDTYEGSIYDPDCLHKYLYANGNPVTYSDPSGNMFDSVSMVVQSGIQSILDNWSQIVYHGLVTGMVNMIISAVTGASFTDACKSFITGFLMGAGLSAIRYFVVGAEIVSLARFYVLEASAEFIFSVTVAIFSISSGNDQMSVVSVVMVILALFHLGNAYGNYLLVDVYGPKGSVSVEVDPTGSNSSRGLLSDFLGKDENVKVGNFYSIKNESGGQVFVSTQNIKQSEIANVVSEIDGNINIISGRHGDYFDNIRLEIQFFNDDVLRFGNMNNVQVYNFAEMTESQIEMMVNSSDTTILGWCYSEYSSFMREVFK